MTKPKHIKVIHLV